MNDNNLKYLELRMCLDYMLLGVALSLFGLILGFRAYSEVGGVLGMIILGGCIAVFLMFAGAALVTMYQLYTFKSRTQRSKKAKKGKAGR